MIVLITGGRKYRNRRELYAVLDRLHAERRFTFLVHGDADGADTLAHKWALERGVQPVAMPALWDYDGEVKAGSKRNKRMLDFAKPSLIVAFSGGRGTANMMKIGFDAGVELIDVEDLELAPN